jgi:hypothetical protein
MATTITVPDFNLATDLSFEDLGYLIQGTGIDRDKKFALSLLRDLLNEGLVTSQTEFNNIITRVGANQYKIADGVTRVYFKNLSGGYDCYSASSFLSDGDTWGYIETNECTALVMENGAYFNVGDNPFYIEVNTSHCALKNIWQKGVGASESSIDRCFYLNANYAIYDNCKVGDIYTDVIINVFKESSTALHNASCKYINCSVYNISSLSSTTINSFGEDTQNKKNCFEYNIEASGEYTQIDNINTDKISKSTNEGIDVEGVKIKNGHIDIVSNILVSNWTERSNPRNLSVRGITWSPDLRLFCVVGNPDGTDAYMITSPDGITWTERSNPRNLSLFDIAWSPELNLFCAVGYPDGTDAYMITSPDGITWTERSNPKNKALNGITWSPELNLFCAVGYPDGTDAYMITSPDGITWTERSNPKNFTLNEITWASELELFCAVGDLDGTDAYMITSPDGITWTERSNPKNYDLLGITWSPELNLFCAVGDLDGTDAYIITSPDGITWTERSNPKNYNLFDITWASELELFCAIGYQGGTDAYMVTSDDGITWTERSNPKNYDLLGITWSPDLRLFCVVGNPDGTDAYMVTSMLN